MFAMSTSVSASGSRRWMATSSLIASSRPEAMRWRITSSM